MTTSDSVGIIAVGCGKWGRRIITNIVNLVAIVDSSFDSLSSFKRDHSDLSSIPCYTSLQDALERHPNAAVVIATPPTTHFHLASLAIKYKRSVFVEKPMCTSFQHAQTLVRLAQTHHVTLMTDHLLQYSLYHRRMVHLVRTGFVGTVNRIRMKRVNFGTIRTGENVLWSFTPHDLSIMISLLPSNDIENATVSCHGQVVVTPSIEDYVDISVSLGQVQAQVEASWLHPFKERRVVVYGNLGAIVLNEDMPDKSLPKLQAFKWTTKPTSDGTAVVSRMTASDFEEHLDLHGDFNDSLSSQESQPLRVALDHFVDCVNAGKTPRTDGNEALRVLALLEASSESLRRGGVTVKVSDVCKGLESTPGPLQNSISISSPFVHPSAVIDEGATIGSRTRIWHFCHVMSGAIIGDECNLGQNVFVGGDVVMGDGVKVQNNVSIYDAVSIADDVFLGPSCVFTNVKNPRAHISRKHQFSKTTIGRGATVGANATIVCGVGLGQYCFVGAGAVVTKDVPAHALVYGNPAKIQGWVSKSGVRLQLPNSTHQNGISMKCPETQQMYTLYENGKDGAPGPVLVPE